VFARVGRLVCCITLAASATAADVRPAAGAPPVPPGPRIVWPDDPAAEPVHRAAAEFLEVLRAGDAAGTATRFSGVGADAELLDAALASVRAGDRLSGSVVKRFPGATLDDPQVRMLFREPAGDLRRRLIVLSGDAASISAGGAALDMGYRLVRGKRGWRVAGLTAGAPDAEGYRKFLESVTGIMTDIAARIDAGEFEDAGAVTAELLERSDEALGAWALPPEAPVARQARPPAARGPRLPAAELSAILGKGLRSDEVARFVSRMPGLPWLSDNGDGGDGGSLWSKDGGVVLAYRGERALVRTVNLFAAGTDGYSQYPGELPAGLTFADTRAHVERKLGRPRWSSGESTYSARYPGRGIEVEYAAGAPRDPAVRIRLITMTVPRDAADEGGDVAAADGGGAKPTLTFRLVVKDGDPDDPALERLADPDAPPGAGRRLLVSRDVLLDGTAVAKVSSTPSDQPDAPDVIMMEMTADGAEQLGRVTAANLNRQLAIVLDGQVLIAPVIRGVVRDRLAIGAGAEATGATTDDVLGRLHAAVHALP
jgi:hypothetical protein